jgi:hypothetical protein
MRLKRKVMKSCLVLCVLGGLAIASVLWHGSSLEGKGPARMGISLVEPALAEEAQAPAFPAHEAGIAAYVKVSAVDIEKVKSIFTEVGKVGDNYIVGITPIPNLGGEINVHLYADTDGWLVAYLKADDPAAKIMKWADSGVGKTAIRLKSTTLEDALHKAGTAAKVGIASGDIIYYDFSFPEANSMTLFIKTCRGYPGDFVQMELPAAYVLYEASYYHVYVPTSQGASSHVRSHLKVDGVEFSNMALQG